MARLRPPKRTGPSCKYPTWMLAVGQSFARIIETPAGAYDWRHHNRIRSAVYRYTRHGGKGKKFTIIQERYQSLLDPKETVLMVVVTRVE